MHLLSVFMVNTITEITKLVQICADGCCRAFAALGPQGCGATRRAARGAALLLAGDKLQPLLCAGDGARCTRQQEPSYNTGVHGASLQRT